MRPSASLDELVGSAGDRLTRTDRRIAALILQDPTKLAFGTVADLASQAETSGPSIVRFAAKLGFDGFSALQDHARRVMSAQLARPTDRVVGAERVGAQGVVAEATEHAVASIDSGSAAFESGALHRMGTTIANAESVYILSGEIGKAGANILASALGLIRPNVVLVERSNFDVGLATAGPSDVAVVLDFMRYKRWVVETAGLLSDRGVQLLAITDNALSPLASMSSQWIGVSVPAVGPFDSSISVVMTAEILVAEVARQMLPDVKQRLDDVEALWMSTGHFYSEDQ